MADSIYDLLTATTNDLNAQSDRYINDLIDTAKGDRDFMIAQIKREHEKALGSNDQQTAQFLEKVADKLEERIGRIPYDYEVATTRTTQDMETATMRTTRGRDRALERLSEDEKVWTEQFETDKKRAVQDQAEALLSRGILQAGTRNEAQGLAGSEVKLFDREIANTLSAYQRALGRNRLDITTSATDELEDINRSGTRQLDDIKTAARRGAIDQIDSTKFGTESAERQFQKSIKELERQRQRLKEQSGTRALTQVAYQSM
jgi:hypothetical protein